MATRLPLAALIVAFAAAGLGAGVINPTLALIKSQRVPAAVRASVYGLIGAGAWAAMPAEALLGRTRG